MIIGPVYIIIIDIVAWGFFHFAISEFCFRIPLAYFQRDHFWSRIKRWEKQGQIWNQLFLVKTWKKHLIDGSSIVNKSYNKKHLHGTSQAELIVFSAETVRAELTHWLLMLPAPLFFLWNPVWAGWVMILYACLVNLPFIMTQRYNRARIQKIINRF